MFEKMLRIDPNTMVNLDHVAVAQRNSDGAWTLIMSGRAEEVKEQAANEKLDEHFGKSLQK